MVFILYPNITSQHCIAGASVWKFASVDDGVNPDVVIVGIGVEVTFEVIAAAALLRKYAPALRVRVVNVTDLMILAAGGTHPHALNEIDFETLFPLDCAVHMNFHGYPIELKGLLFGRPHLERVTIEGYREEGTTTSPLDMMLVNHTSRYHVAAAAVRGGAQHNPRICTDAVELAARFMHMAQKDHEYILQYGEDPAGTFDVPKFG
ncbi:Xylulose 5-phosphate/Fructose 6-phosphate phosphoketolase [Russula brevipes]|nr:Xylulose 5-phosphate/Fructose 6-phosphate phosphoketolase [Russula brevipes]